MLHLCLRGALAFFLGASCSVKFGDGINDDRVIDVTIARCKVNAAK